jgi:ribosomal protein L17
MNHERPEGDSITVGNVTSSQGVAIGRNTSVQVTGNNIISGTEIDAKEVRAALEALYDGLDKAGLPKDKIRSVQTAAGNAIEAVTDKEVKADIVADNVKKIGETIKQANVAIEEGSSLWHSIRRLSPLLGPLVGGARIVAAWFGVPI